MNEPTTAGQWSELQTKLKKQYPKLTKADLEFHESLGQDMLRMVEYKLGKTREEMRKIIKSL